MKVIGANVGAAKVVLEVFDITIFDREAARVSCLPIARYDQFANCLPSGNPQACFNLERPPLDHRKMDHRKTLKFGLEREKVLKLLYIPNSIVQIENASPQLNTVTCFAT